jgi:hypothetical protein
VSKLGTKYTCWSCATKFYDLNKPDPKCPKCGSDPAAQPDAGGAPAPEPDDLDDDEEIEPVTIPDPDDEEDEEEEE